MSSQNWRFLIPPTLVVFFIRISGLCSKSSFGLPPSPYQDDIVYGWPLIVASKVQLLSKGHFGIFKMSDKKIRHVIILKSSNSDLSDKVELFSEGLKNLHNLPHCLYILHLLSKRPNHEED